MGVGVGPFIAVILLAMYFVAPLFLLNYKTRSYKEWCINLATYLVIPTIYFLHYVEDWLQNKLYISNDNHIIAWVSAPLILLPGVIIIRYFSHKSERQKSDSMRARPLRHNGFKKPKTFFVVLVCFVFLMRLGIYLEKDSANEDRLASRCQKYMMQEYSEYLTSGDHKKVLEQQGTTEEYRKMKESLASRIDQQNPDDQSAWLADKWVNLVVDMDIQDAFAKEAYAKCVEQAIK